MKEFCKTCGDTEFPGHEDRYDLKDIAEEDKKYLFTYNTIDADHEEIICETCYNDYYYEPLCTLCHERGDYCQGHGHEEREAFGFCPICDEETWDCHGHGLAEWREYYAKNRPSH